MIEAREALRTAIADANARLDEEGLVTFDADDEDDRTKAVARTINLSLSLLDEKQRARFAELAVFPEDADIPVDIVRRLWRHSAGLSEGRAKDLLIRFQSLSLLLNLDLSQGTLRFHDTIRKFLQDQAGQDGLITQHQRLLEWIADVAGSAEVDAPTRRYFYQWRLYHLSAAADRMALDRLLVDPGWLQAKLAALQNPQALVADYDRYGASEIHRLIGRTLRLTMGICARDQSQLIPQLIGRLMGSGGNAVSRFLEEARTHLAASALLSRTRSLTPPGAEIARLGHTAWITALCALADGRLASGSRDRMIRLWDPATGAETARLDGHTGGVWALCALADSRLASGSDDQTIRLWNPATGAETARLEIDAPVLCLTAAADTLIVAGDQLGRLHWLDVV